jgi:hypothetical protein
MIAAMEEQVDSRRDRARPGLPVNSDRFITKKISSLLRYAVAGKSPNPT